MIASFADDTTRDLFDRKNSKAARRIPQRVWSAAYRRLAYLDAIAHLSDLAGPGYQLHALAQTKPPRQSIKINDQYRITFLWQEGHAHDVRVEDYH